MDVYAGIGNPEQSMMTSALQFQLESASIRPWKLEDARSLAENADNYKIWRNLRDSFPHPYALSDATKYISRHLNPTDPSNLAIEVDGVAVGGIGIRPFPERGAGALEIGYWLGEHFWGKGIMTEAVTVLSDFALDEELGGAIYAMVLGWNRASARLLEKAGFLLVETQKGAVLRGSEVTDELVYLKKRTASP